MRLRLVDVIGQRCSIFAIALVAINLRGILKRIIESLQHGQRRNDSNTAVFVYIGFMASKLNNKKLKFHARAHKERCQAFAKILHMPKDQGSRRAPSRLFSITLPINPVLNYTTETIRPLYESQTGSLVAALFYACRTGDFQDVPGYCCPQRHRRARARPKE